MNAKAFISRNKKPLIIVSAILLVIIISLSGFFIATSVIYNEKLKLAVQMQEGTVVEYDWKSSDAFNIADYPAITVDGDARILYMTDTHFTENTKYTHKSYIDFIENNMAKKHIQKLVSEAQPHLIVIAGDVLTDVLSDMVMQQFCDFMDTFEVPWTMVYGNHDAEWRADKAKLNNIIESAKYSVYKQGPTNIQGLGNSIVNIKNKNGEIFYSVITMDTGDWQKINETKINWKNIVLDKSNRRFSTSLEEGVGYSDAQADWYKWVVEGLKTHNNNINIKTAVVSHIPLKAVDYAFALDGKIEYNQKPRSTDAGDFYKTPQEFENPKTADEWLKTYNDYKQNYKFYNFVTSLGSTKDIITGHNHSYGYAVTYDGVTHTSVVKTDSIYTNSNWDMGKRGGTLYVVGADGVVKSNQPIYIKG